MNLRTSLRLLSIFTACAANSCSSSFAYNVGVGVHMGQTKISANEVVTGLRSIGLDSIRDEIYWDHVEKERGKYLDGKGYKEIRKAVISLSDNKLSDSIVVMGYGNPLYENGGRPKLEASRKAFGTYAAYVASRIEGRIGIVEIWNEWNLPTGRGIDSPGLATDYISLAEESISAIRMSGFTGKILVGGVGGDWPDWQFTRKIAESGLLKSADGYSIHLYNFARSSNPSEMIDRMEALQRVLSAANGGQAYPVYVTEVGWPTHVGRHGSSERTAAVKTAAFLLEAMKFHWLKGVWIYELFDSGRSKVSIEDNFGLLKSPWIEKEHTCLISQAARTAKSSRYLEGGKLKYGYWLTLDSNGQRYHVIATTAPMTVVVPRGWSQYSVNLCDIDRAPVAKLQSSAREEVLVDGVLVIKANSMLPSGAITSK